MNPIKTKISKMYNRIKSVYGYRMEEADWPSNRVMNRWWQHAAVMKWRWLQQK